MRKSIAIACTTLLAVIASTFVVSPAQAAVGIRISGGRLVEANGTALKLRGINHPHVWFTNQTSSFANIKAAGANSVRVVLSGGRWATMTTAQVAEVVTLCKNARLICVLENHDTTGYNEQQSEWSLDRSVSWWISVQAALTGQENYVILNIGNEPFGNGSSPVSSSAWPQQTSAAIQRLRNAGFQHTIMVDAPNWGQDWGFVMRDNAPQVLAADTSGNTIFSVHMYGVYDTAAEVNAYVDSFTSRGLALCVCEFGHMHSDGDPNEDAIMTKTQSAAIGNMGWSWSGNGGGVEYLDMVTSFNPAQRGVWGNRYITGANGLSTTSTEATIYGGQPGDTTPPSVPGSLRVTSVSSSAINLAWNASSDNVAVTGYDIFRAPGTSGGTFASVGTSTGTTFSNTGLSANQTFRYQVRARDAAGNVSGFSTAVTGTTSSGGGDTTPPSVPSGLTVSGVTSSAINLSWSVSSDNVAVTGYDIFRAPGTSGGTFASVGTSTGTTFSNTGLSANQTFRYQVRARDAAGNVSGFSSAVTGTTSGGGGGGGCSITLTAQSQWGNGYVIQPANVTNTGTAAITSWTVTITLPAGHAITGSWNTALTISGQTATARPVGHNSNLGPGATGQFGFQASRPNGNTALPTATCAVP